jgi:Holliday junction DNA helicase RuvA
VIATLSGTLGDILPDGAIVDVHGVGYRVYMPSSAVAKLPKRGSQVRMHTHTHVREDAITLYGFFSGDEREMFEVLIGVNGIGPKNALAILGANTPGALRRSVVAEDVAALTAIPGIGKKTAARIVLELKEKLALPDLAIVPNGDPAVRARLAEVRDALLQLGYTTTEARDAMERIDLDGDEESTESLLRVALKELAGAKR